jgi:hypothetical protein
VGGFTRHRSSERITWLGTPENAPAQPQQPLPGLKQDVDYNMNLFKCNGTIQKFNNDNWNSQRRQPPNKGVQIQKAY